MSDLREELAAALPPHQTWCQAIGHFDCCGKTDADCDCGITESLDALLPVVRRYAARELREAADRLRGELQFWSEQTKDGFAMSVGELDSRADALEADT